MAQYKINKERLISSLIFLGIIVVFYIQFFNKDERYINDTIRHKLSGKIIKIARNLHTNSAQGSYIQLNSDTLHFYIINDKNIHRDLASEISIGDSVYKEAGNDTVYFYTSSGNLYITTTLKN